MPKPDTNNGKLTLELARELTPPVPPLEAMRRQLQLALFDGIKEQDVLDMATKLKEMAMAGDLKAMKMFLDLAVGKDQKPAPPPPSPTAGVAEAIRDLVDEIRISRAGPPKSRLKEIANGKPHGDE